MFSTFRYCFAVLICVSLISAELLFEDHFSTRDNWTIAASDYTDSVEAGVYTVENTSSQYSLFVKHDASFSTFTYHVKIKAISSTYNLLGLVFCMDNNDGYIYSITNMQQYTLWKKTGEEITILKTGWNSFINTSENVLHVSKNGPSINLFCNNVFIDSVTDATYASGGIGMILGPLEKVATDYVIVTGDAVAPTEKKYFADSFDDNNLDGWHVLNAAGTPGITSGALAIPAGTSGPPRTIIYSDGTYPKAPVGAVVTKTGGNDEGFYGLILMKNRVDDSVKRSFDAFVFQITGKKQYAAYYLSTGDSTKFSVLTNSNINGTKDTLQINSDYSFSVNGVTLPDIDFSGKDFAFNAVGFIVDADVSVSFDDFTAGDTAYSIIVMPEKRMRGPVVRPVFTVGGMGIMYNPMGRKVARRYNLENEDQAGLGAGQYYFVPGGSKKYPIRRAIIKK